MFQIWHQSNKAILMSIYWPPMVQVPPGGRENRGGGSGRQASKGDSNMKRVRNQLVN